MNLNVSDREFVALLWALQVVSAETLETPERFGPGTGHLQEAVRDLGARITKFVPEVLERIKAEEIKWATTDFGAD